MNFIEALKKLGIEDYKDRIINSNSHGELIHCCEYIQIAMTFKSDLTWFRGWFEEVIEMSKETERPETIFQYPIKMLLLTFSE